MTNAPILKAGCLMFDIRTAKTALVLRQNEQDYTFPKGHVEPGESFIRCAARETEEETGYVCDILPTHLPVFNYQTSKNEKVEVHFFAARAVTESKQYIPENLKHITKWIPIEEVGDYLSYANLKYYWNQILPLIKKDLFKK